MKYLPWPESMVCCYLLFYKDQNKSQRIAMMTDANKYDLQS